MTAYRYTQIPQIDDAAVVIEGANGDSYLYGNWINRFIEPMLAGVIDAAGLSGQYDYTDILKRTAERLGGDEYWHVVFPDGTLISDAPKSFVKMLLHIESFEAIYGIKPVTPKFRDLLRSSIYIAAFTLLLEDATTGPSNVPISASYLVKLFIECFFPCAHFKWE